MSLGVNWNSSAVRTHRNVVMADRSLSKVLDHLSSGLRLTKASDDPSSMVLANNLRYQLAGLDQATANAEEGVSMIQTADGAMDEMSSLLNHARALALQAANEGINDPAQLSALQSDLDEVIRSVSRIASDTRFGSKNLLDGTIGGISLTSTTRTAFSDVTTSRPLMPGGIKAASPVTLNVPLAGLTLSRDVATTTYSSSATGTPPATIDTALANLWQNPGGANQTQLTALPGTLTLTGPGGTQTVPLTATTTFRSLVATINESSGSTGIKADFSNGALTIASLHAGANTLTIDSTDLGGGNGLLATNPGAPGLGNAFRTGGTTQTLDLTYVDDQDVTHLVTLTQDPASEGGLTFTNLAGAPELVPPYSAYAPGAISVTAKDTSGGVVGANILINGTDSVGNAIPYSGTRESPVRIHTGAMTNQDIALDIPDMRASALGFGAGLLSQGFGTLESLTTNRAFLTYSASQALKVIDAAIEEVASTRGKLGAVQSSGIETTVSSLRITVENLTASESQLRDVDYAAESAQYARYNIMYQAATAMLGQANQIPQTVLQLLKG